MADQWESLQEELISLVSSSKPSEIEVPSEVYSKCSELFASEKYSSTPCRYPYLKGSRAYTLMVDFLRKNLTEEELKRKVDISEKLNRLKQALKALIKYGLNLIGSPHNKLFHRVKLTSPYFVYNVKKHCIEGELFLRAMGYQQKPSTSEMLYAGSGGPVTVDRMKVAGTVIDLLVIVEMLDALLKLRESLKQDHLMYDLETVFRDEFQEPLATAGGMVDKSAPHVRVAEGGLSERRQRSAGNLQEASQQRLGQDVSRESSGTPNSYPLPSTAGRMETSMEFHLGDLPRLYPSAPPTARELPQAQTSSTAPVQVTVKQTIYQPTSSIPVDMYGDSLEGGMGFDEQPPLEQRQQLPQSPQPRNDASRVRQVVAVTHITGYSVDSQASRLHNIHLSDSAAHDWGYPGAAHPQGRGQMSAPSEPHAPVQNEYTKVDYSRLAGSNRPAPTEGLDIVNVAYHTNASPEVKPVAQGESAYHNASVLNQAAVLPQRPLHDSAASRSPVPAPRRGPRALSTPSEPQTAHHSFTPPMQSQHARSRPHATGAYQSLAPTQQAQYAHLNPQSASAYQPLGHVEKGQYAPLLPTDHRNPLTSEDYRSLPPVTSSSGSEFDARQQPVRPSAQRWQLPETPHSSGDYYNVSSHGAVAPHSKNPHVDIPTSKSTLPHLLAVECHHCNDSSGSGGQHSGEYSKHGPSSDEEHSGTFPGMITRL